MGVYLCIWAYKNKETREPTYEFEIAQDFKGSFFYDYLGNSNQAFAESYGLWTKYINFFFLIDVSAYYGDEYDSVRYFDPQIALNGLEQIISTMDQAYHLTWKTHFDEMAQFLQKCVDEHLWVQIKGT